MGILQLFFPMASFATYLMTEQLLFILHDEALIDWDMTKHWLNVQATFCNMHG